MVKWNRPSIVFILLETLRSCQSFQTQRASFSRRRVASLSNHNVASSSYQGYAEGEIGNSTNYFESLKSVLDDDDDADQAEIEKRREQILRRMGASQKVSFPLSQAKPFGIRVIEVSPGLKPSDVELDLDSLFFVYMNADSNVELIERLDASFRGLMVKSVSETSIAWRSGVRPGDILQAISATIGDALWPKSTFEGVRSAISLRKITSGSIVIEFKRLAEQANNQYELSLTRPIGLMLQESEDGYVEVTGYTESAPTLVKYAVQVGDRVLAVDSSFGGQLWPVSTVEGVISACTSRLPGQAVKMRFERPLGNMGAVRSATLVATNEAPVEKVSAPDIPIDVDQRVLLTRCRQVLRRYSNEEVQSRFRGKYAVQALVADKVVDALASAQAAVDSITLNMIMNAYLACQQPEKALRIFESATGFSADGSLKPPAESISGVDGKRIIPNESALNLYTGTALLKAHAKNGDIFSAVRVLAALEGRSGVEVGDLESAPWPWTGVYGAIQPDTQCYNTAIAAAERIGGSYAVNFALDLFERMGDPSKESVVNGLPVRDVVTYNTMISTLSNSGRLEDAFNLFGAMKRSSIRPDKYTYTSLIKACRDENDIQEMLYDMRELGVVPDIVTYNTMIKSLCEAKKWTEATKLVTEMETKGVAPDSMTYGYLMNAMLKADKPNACLALFESACVSPRTSSLTENIHLYTTAVTAAGVLGDHERALELVSRMNAVGIKPNLKTLTAVIGACLTSGRPDLGVKLYERIDKPDGYAMAQVVRALCANSERRRAFDLLRKQRRGSGAIMSGKEIMRSYNEVIKTSLAASDLDLAREAVADLLGQGYIPSNTIVSSVAETLGVRDIAESSAVEIFAFGLHVIDSLRKRNLPVDGYLYVAVLSLGNHLGGLPRKVASFLVQSKARADTSSTAILSEHVEDVFRFIGWEDFFANYDDYKQYSPSELLPPVTVRIGMRDTRRVLRAEQAVAYSSRSKSNKKQRSQPIASQ